jgi:hypothetical protein
MVGGIYDATSYSPNITGFSGDTYITTCEATQYTTAVCNVATIAGSVITIQNYATGGTGDHYSSWPVTHNHWPSGVIGIGAIGVASGYIISSHHSYAWPQETPEEKETRLKREAETAERLKRAERKARGLLLDTIGKEEFKKYKKCGYVEVTGPSGTTYRLKPGERIIVMGKDGKVSHKLCLVYNDPKYPPTDLIVHEYLMILAGQEDFIEKTANRFAA